MYFLKTDFPEYNILIWNVFITKINSWNYIIFSYHFAVKSMLNKLDFEFMSEYTT